MNEVGRNRSMNRPLTRDDLKIAQRYLRKRLKEELSKPKYKSCRALARYIIDTADRVDGNKEYVKESRTTATTSEKKMKGIDILVKRISEIHGGDDWKDIDLQEKVIQRLYKGLEEKKLISDDIDRLRNLADGNKDDRLGDRSDLIQAYFDLPIQTDQLLREFFRYNNVPQPILICGFAFGRTLEQARKYIPRQIAKGYTFHFLVFNSFSTSKYREAYSNLIAYHYFEGNMNDVDYNCYLSLKYMVQTMYYIKAEYNEINQKKRVRNRKDNLGLIDRSNNEGGKGFLGRKFQVAFYDFPLFYYGLFSNLPDDADVNEELDNRFHFIAPEINECERSAHPIHFYRESENLKPVIRLYKESAMKQWKRATKFDSRFKSLPTRNEKYSPSKIEEEAKVKIGNVVEACKLGEGESIFDYFTW